MSRVAEKIRKSLKDLGNPSSYFTGVSGSVNCIPTNITVWMIENRNDANHQNLHQRFCTSITLSGETFVRIDDKSFHLNAGEGIVIFPFQTHRFQYMDTSKPFCRVHINFEMKDDTCVLPLKNSPFSFGEKEWAIMEDIAGKYKGLDVDAENTAYLLALLLNQLLINKERLFPEFQNMYNGVTIENKFMKDLFRYINENYEKDLKIVSIAKHLNVSESHLRYLFRKHTGGMSLGKFIKQFKICNSLLYLSHTDKNIQDVARECGYSSMSTFYRSFGRYLKTGDSPLHYQNRKFSAKNQKKHKE